VQRIGAVVLGERIGLAVDAERAALDAIGVAADGGAEIVGRDQIALHVVIAERHVLGLTLAIGHRERLEDRAIA